MESLSTAWHLVSFVAARAGVTQRSPSPRGDGERCVTPAWAAAKETTRHPANQPCRDRLVNFTTPENSESRKHHELRKTSGNLQQAKGFSKVSSVFRHTVGENALKRIVFQTLAHYLGLNLNTTLSFAETESVDWILLLVFTYLQSAVELILRLRGHKRTKWIDMAIQFTANFFICIYYVNISKAVC